MCKDCGCDTPKKIDVFQNILSGNEKAALVNKDYLKNVFCMNFMGSPGSGKTTLLEAILDKGIFKMSVVQGDLSTDKDMQRVTKKGAFAYQITTGQTCHLDAKMVYEGLLHLPILKSDVVVIENVGNLVCPASYTLGEDIKVAFVSVPEGSDKVAKYPVMFKNADVLIISKIGLLEHFDFDVQDAIYNAKMLNPNIKIFQIDSKDDVGVLEFCDYILKEINLKKENNVSFNTVKNS